MEPTKKAAFKLTTYLDTGKQRQNTTKPTTYSVSNARLATKTFRTQQSTSLENSLFQAKDDNFHVAVAKILDEACKLLGVGFEYICDMDNVKLFRKRK